MAQVKFGRKQLKNPTPSKLASGILLFTGISGVVIMWIPTATYIGVHTREISSSILGLLIAIGNFAKPFFGIQPTQAQVEVSNVTEMETPKEDKTD